MVYIHFPAHTLLPREQQGSGMVASTNQRGCQAGSAVVVVIA
eukprot:COSAG01_NODE_70553_length_258_cov_0.654088_1_plen_41_part_10